MKKFILSIFIIGSFGFYVIWQNTGNSSVNFKAETPVVSSSNKKVLNKPTQPVVALIPKNKNLYNDGTYVGNPAFAYNENVQVEAIISNGKISDIKFLQYPNRGRSGSISSFALPILKEEAIQSQNVKVDAVSGASFTSPAFVESLTSALSQAQA